MLFKSKSTIINLREVAAAECISLKGYKPALPDNPMPAEVCRVLLTSGAVININIRHSHAFFQAMAAAYSEGAKPSVWTVDD